jgi:uncharacterized repeat protein (TIGR01451 family)
VRAVQPPLHSNNPRLSRARAGAVRLGWLLGAALAVVVPGCAAAASIFNTAVVSYRDASNPGQVITVKSNTVETPLLPAPTPASLQFLRYDPTASGASPTPIDGTQCRVAGGSFAPAPGVVGSDGQPVDPAAPQADQADGYYVGEPAIVTINDPNRNADPSTREYTDVDLSTTTGDAETLRLQETGPDTGVFAGAIQTVAVPPAATQYDCELSLAAYAQSTARYTDTDFPLDALAVAAAGYAPLQTHTVIRLTQSVSKDIVEIGDFLQYTLVVANSHDAPALNTRIRDVLPPGLRYRAGSLRVGNAAQPGDPDVTPASLQRGFSTAATTVMKAPGGMAVANDPIIAADGRTFVFPVGNLKPGGSVTATFVAEVGAGAAGQHLVNYAIASANGALSSNETDTVVRMRESLDMTRFTIIGRVMEDATCNTPPEKRTGVAKVRVLLEDGTYVATDANGAYHFEGVRPGTHVAQVDPASVPADMEVAPCLANTRFAGRADSQFVEAQGGSVVRADFFLRPKAPAAGSAGVRLRAESRADGLHYTIDLDGVDVPLSNVRAMLVLPAGTHYASGSTTVDGIAAADPVLTEGVATFNLGDPGTGWHRTITLLLAVDGRCPADGYAAKAIGMFESGGKRQQTPSAGASLGCGAPPGPADSGRVAKTVTAAASGQAASPFAEQAKKRGEILDTITAGGGKIDWLRGQAPGTDMLFPAPGYNPRAPVTRVVVKRAANQTVALRVNGEEVDQIRYDGTRSSADGSVVVDLWNGIALKDGDNTIQARILDASGATVQTLSRTVRYATVAASVQFVPEQSILVADGFTKPVFAVRILDASGHPLHEGLTGDYTLSAPYLPARNVDGDQQRAFAGLERSKPTWRIEGDDGIAYIELEPTSVAGNAILGFRFRSGGRKQQQEAQELQVQAWLKSAPRDWIVVGFAKGSIGYDTLKDNMRALQPGEDGKGVRGDGQAALYAKGRVLGKWLLTLSYDSGKPTDRLRNQSLLSTIDPGQYYTLYGDGSQQGYDASSARKLYLKLERDQFYALFGDFESGLGKTELSRYQRTLNGAKVEYHGPMVEFTGFAARTAQTYARDELQGDGTSGLYRLRRAGIVLNSERVRIETRDRYHSEQIIQSRDLVRHIDYDIDYDNGTLFFREPIASRDFDHNPNWIVAEYETRGTSEEYLDAGGRVGVKLMGDRLEAGVSYISDDGAQGRSQLAGVDARFRFSPSDQLRAEAAASRADRSNGDVDGNAWLVEWSHRTEALTLLAYTRRQAGAFGLGQQNATESGMFKAGVQGQYRVSPKFSLQGEAYRLENLGDGSTRNVAQAQVEYRGEGWKAKAGLQWAHDEAADGAVAESRQVTAGVTRTFLHDRLELAVQADFSLPGKNESVDFPTRVTLGAAYRINSAFRVVAAQEFTDGKDRDTSTTRIGFEAKPWKDATLTSTLNQSQISEYGPRTFALFGLDQKFTINKQWSVDAAVDSSQAFNQSGKAPLVVDPSQPVQAGGIRNGGALTENFVAVSGGVNYRTPLWAWNARVEARQSDSSDRYGFTTAFLRQVKDGVALAASAQAFTQRNADGSTGILANAQLSWAFRPLGSEWSMLDKLEFHYDGLQSGTGDSILGQATIAARGDARSTRLVNNFALNYASDAWRAEDGGDGKGSVLDLYQRSQLSLYYGSKYVLDSYDGDDYAGYTDILGIEGRFDLTPRIDIGLRASILHSWSQHSYAWAFGPSVGFTPFTNAWVSVGYNIRGFNDRDFEASHYTAKGAYLVFRMKFDQHSLGLDRVGPPAGAAQH